VPSLGRQLTTLVLEVAGMLGAAALLAAFLTGPGSWRPRLRRCAPAAVAAFALAIGAGQLSSTASILGQAHSHSVSAAGGRDWCFGESWPGNPGGAGRGALPFVRWARSQLGAHARYTILGATPPSPPDRQCLYLALLPALPAAPGQQAEWTIAFGSIPPSLHARIAAHDPAVRAFSPDFALARQRRR
jgi:hypothetical protein